MSDQTMKLRNLEHLEHGLSEITKALDNGTTFIELVGEGVLVLDTLLKAIRDAWNKARARHEGASVRLGFPELATLLDALSDALAEEDNDE